MEAWTSVSMLLSRLGFSNKGFTTAVLKASGKMPVLRDVFIMFRTQLEMLLNICLKNAAGTGSIHEMEELHLMTISQSSV